MHSVWCKYIYNKIRMKNLPILFTLYWLTMQIYAIVTLLDGLVEPQQQHCIPTHQLLLGLLN